MSTDQSTLIARLRDYPLCSSNPQSCPENEGFGCCGLTAQSAQIARLMALADKMMRDSWATGDDAAYAPARAELESALRTALAAAPGEPQYMPLMGTPFYIPFRLL